MKKLFSLLTLLALSVLPLACANRPLDQPVNPAFNAPTPTPTTGYNYTYAASPTATP